ncbi:MAG TPA: translocation/assembly module TamB domain-containing protein [Devosiaceae bacterium]
MRRLLAALLVGLALLMAMPLIVMAQADQDPEAQKSAFLRFVQDRLSTPDRIIRISNIDGALSSDASIGEITVADSEGVWLRISKATINWNQGALLFGRLEVNSLAAEQIDVIRNPAPAKQDPGLPAPEAGGFSVPQLPVAVILKQLSVPKVTFGDSVFGLGSQISVTGNITLDGGSLDSALNIIRLDGPGGTLDAKAKFAKDTQNLDLGLTLTEPKDGIIANLLRIEGRPDVKLTVTGSGPVTNLKTDLSLDADGKRALTGVATIAQGTTGMTIATDLRGPIADLVAVPFRPFFGAETALTANALLRQEGGVTLTGLTLSGGQLSLNADAETTKDGFLRSLMLKANIDGKGNQVTLPVPGAMTQVDTAAIAIDFGADGSDNWTSSVNVAGFETPGLKAQTLKILANGVAANLDDAATRRVTFNTDGELDGITTSSPDMQAALGDTIGFGVAGLWNAGQPVQLAQVRLEGKALTLALKGVIDNWVYDGDVAVKTASISPFSGVAGRPLSGALSLLAKGTISPLIGGFNLTLDGTGDNLTIGDTTADKLLAGQVRLTGGVARTETGLEAHAFRIANDQVQVDADGTFATGNADFTFGLGLADLGLLSPQASGRLTAKGTARGTGDTVALAFNAEVPNGALARRVLQKGTFGFNGTLTGGDIAGKLSGDAFLDGFRVSLGADVAANADSKRLSNLSFEAGGTKLTGDIAQDQAGLLTAQLDLNSSNVTTAAALLLTEATGAANASITLSPVNGEQSATMKGSVRNLVASGASIGQADIAASIADLFGVPEVEGTVSGSNISAGGVNVARLNAKANRSDDTTGFDAQASLTNGTALDVAGALSPLDQGYKLALDRANLTQGALAARLARPAALTVNGQSVSMDAVQFNVGTGSITATGTAGDALDINLAIRALPLSIANAVAPDLALGGTLNGTARIGGTAKAPQATFQLAGDGIDAAAVRPLGISPISFSANGSFANNAVTLAALRANGAGGLNLSGSGTVPLAGNGLAVTLNGSAPLSLANRFVADRGGQASGTLTLNARATGSIAAPKFAGEVSTRGAQYVDPQLNLRLNDITGSATLTGDSVTINALNAALATGGTVGVSGTVSLQGPSYPANLAIKLNSARYADGSLLVATVSGNLALTGPLTRSPLLAGNIAVEKADLSIPERIGGGATLIDVTHKDVPKAVAQTLARADIDKPGAAPTPRDRPSILQLNVNITAPNQIFLRGRGLDAELGGSVRLTGPATDIQPVGGFNLIRGRLSILGQRVTFESGSVTLVGDLDPYVNLVARTEGDDITVFVTVAGRASEIQVTFSSTPELPQDEVLSRLIFKRSMDQLSPLQLAKLAGAAASLAGGGGGSLVDSLRDAAGLSDLDVVTDDKGNVAVQAGTYIQDNIYLGVQAGANGQSKVTVNLDITGNLKAKGSVGADGNSDIGVFYEKDY